MPAISQNRELQPRLKTILTVPGEVDAFFAVWGDTNNMETAAQMTNVITLRSRNPENKLKVYTASQAKAYLNKLSVEQYLRLVLDKRYPGGYPEFEEGYTATKLLFGEHIGDHTFEDERAARLYLSKNRNLA